MTFERFVRTGRMNTPTAYIAVKAARSMLTPYLRLRHVHPVWYHVLNRDAKRLFHIHGAQLDTVQESLVGNLKRDGIAVVHIDELFPGRDMLDELQTYTAKLSNSAEVKTQKTFLQYLWDAYPIFDLQNPFLKLALEENVLDVVNSYFDMFSKFYYFTLNITMPVGKDAKAVQSQPWHRDPEDKKMCKIFIYLNDVGEDAGPFMYVRSSQYGGRWGHLFPQRPPNDTLPPASVLEKTIPPEDIRVCTGRAGTVIFCDTGGLHKGGYATDKERIMFTGGYCSSAAIRHLRFRYPEGFQADTAKLSPAAQFALVPFDNKLVTRAFCKLWPNHVGANHVGAYVST
jgi:hypothetical protein